MWGKAHATYFPKHYFSIFPMMSRQSKTAKQKYVPKKDWKKYVVMEYMNDFFLLWTFQIFHN